MAEGEGRSHRLTNQTCCRRRDALASSRLFSLRWLPHGLCGLGVAVCRAVCVRHDMAAVLATTKRVAITMGVTEYHPNRPCLHGHHAPRLVSNYSCKDCN